MTTDTTPRRFPCPIWCDGDHDDDEQGVIHTSRLGVVPVIDCDNRHPRPSVELQVSLEQYVTHEDNGGLQFDAAMVRLDPGSHMYISLVDPGVIEGLGQLLVQHAPLIRQAQELHPQSR